MRKLILLSSIAVLISATEIDVNKTEIAKEGVKYIKMLGSELKANVKKRLQADPTGIDAVKFCSENASKIIHNVASKFPEHIKVRRVATKYRNPANKPDKVDSEVLKKMEEGLKNQTLPKGPMVVDVNGTSRVYVPLIVEKACLKCHGDPQNMNSMVKRVIKKHYPEDKAIGFREGDLRGAVVAEIAPKK